MAGFQSTSSGVGTLSDLDGFSVQGDHYLPVQTSFPNAESDDFGFDPPSSRNSLPFKIEQPYSPPEDSEASLFGGWPGMDIEKVDPLQLSPDGHTQTTEIDRMIAQNLPNASSAIARYGQVTPPRSGSETSILESKSNGGTPKACASERRRRPTKASEKSHESTPNATASGRKRRNTRRASMASTGDPEEDEKRKQSLEKNRLAAAKCRVNKKEKTEQLQRDSHEKAVHNAFLKEQVMRMKEEVQQMNALLLAHANCDGCKSPADIQKHLSDLGNEFFAQHLQPLAGSDYAGYSSIDANDLDHSHHGHHGLQENFFAGHSDSLNPPLPEFDRTPDFDVSTPMHTD